MELEREVWSETLLCELLGIEKRTLDLLRREKGFPFVSLTTRERVYLPDAVVGWLKEHCRKM